MESVRKDVQDPSPDLVLPSLAPAVAGIGGIFCLFCLLALVALFVLLPTELSQGDHSDALRTLVLVASVASGADKGLIAPPKHENVDLRATTKGLYCGHKEIVRWDRGVQYRLGWWRLKIFLEGGRTVRQSLLNFEEEARERLLRRMDQELKRRA